MEETLRALKLLIADGFQVMVYCSDDPVYALKLEEAGAAAIMPAAAPIGSGRGIQNYLNLGLIIEQAKVPVLVDAGVGTASDAVLAMELGCDAVLMNTAIAEAHGPDPHGRRHEARGHRRPRSLPRRPHGQADLRRPVVAPEGLI